MSDPAYLIDKERELEAEGILQWLPCSKGNGFRNIARKLRSQAYYVNLDTITRTDKE